MTRGELVKVVTYDSLTGKFYRNKAHRGFDIGSEIGCKNNKGYITVKINKIAYKAHRLAWLYMTGDWPKDQIDHIDMVKSNNAWYNLREASNGENQYNQTKYKNNKSGYKGVCWDKTKCAWVAQIRKNCVNYKLGVFTNPEEAFEAYKSASLLMHGAYRRIN